MEKDKLTANADSPRVIAAKIESPYRNEGYYWDVLYLHTPNKHDRLQDRGYYYYDCAGEEIPASMVTEFNVLER